jgi:hypothetical protein
MYIEKKEKNERIEKKGIGYKIIHSFTIAIFRDTDSCQSAENT